MKNTKKITALVSSVILCVGLMAGCTTRTDYHGWATWEFINESGHSLKVETDDKELNFELTKGGGHSFELYYGTGKEIDESTFDSPYQRVATKIILDGEKEVTQTGITDRKNYIAEKIESRHYKYTYTFTDEDFKEKE
mgnify:CR=1 FL=1